MEEGGGRGKGYCRRDLDCAFSKATSVTQKHARYKFVCYIHTYTLGYERGWDGEVRGDCVGVGAWVTWLAFALLALGFSRFVHWDREVGWLLGMLG
jgi:hypothetical protein